MKKKKLKQRIRQIESEIGQSKSNEKIWKDMVYRFVDELKGYGVKAEIIHAEQPTIEVSRTEDMTAKYIPGMITEPPALSFDFTDHDLKIRKK